MHKIKQCIDKDKTGAGMQFYVKMGYEAVMYGLCLYYQSS